MYAELLKYSPSMNDDAEMKIRRSCESSNVEIMEISICLSKCRRIRILLFITDDRRRLRVIIKDHLPIQAKGAHCIA